MTAFFTAEPQLCQPRSVKQPRGVFLQKRGSVSLDLLGSFDCVQFLGMLEFVPNPILSICISLPGGIWLQWFPASPLLSGKPLRSSTGRCGRCISEMPLATLAALANPRVSQAQGRHHNLGRFHWLCLAGCFPGMGRSSRITPQELCLLCAASFCERRL